MVTARLFRKIVFATAFVILAGGLVWMLIPSMTLPSDDAFGQLPLTALMTCRKDKGCDPRNFGEVEPYLEMITRTDCEIVQTSHENYEVRIPLKDNKIYIVKLTYTVDENGFMEKYDVHSTRRESSGK